MQSIRTALLESSENLDSDRLRENSINDNEDNMNKRQRDLSDCEDEKSLNKIKKINANTSHEDCFIDLTSDNESNDVVIVKKEKNGKMSDDDESSDYFSGNIASKENGINDNEKKSTQDSEYFDVNDSALMKGLLSQFSDDDDDNDEIKADSAHGGSILLTQSTISSIGVPTKSQVLNGKEKSTIRFDSGLNSEEIKFEDEFDFICDWDDEKNGLDLSNFTRCKIVDIVKQRIDTRVTVESAESFDRATVLLSGSWKDIKIETEELVVIKAVKSLNDWVVNNNAGMVVTQPDELVAGTTVVQGIFCERKGVLLQKYNGINCLPNIPTDDAVMTCGIIVHELLQTALRDQIYNLQDLWKLLETILQYPHIIQILYASNLTIKEIKELVDEYVMKTYLFLGRYVIGNRSEDVDNNFQGQIETIRDIEENVWLPSLGVKGKVDVTVEVSINNKRKVMPLEIKTGRALFSHEHKGQLYLYCMMLENLGYEMDSGLLLYIKENRMREIKSTRHEQRDLILLRNSLAYFLSKNPYPEEKLKRGTQEKIKVWTLPELPDPINHVVGCKRCPFSTICCTYAQEAKLKLREDHHYNEIYKTALKHLTDDHIDYVINWISMLQIENAYNKSVDANHVIWSQKPLMREIQQTCLSYLKIVEPVEQEKDGYYHTFVRASIDDPNIKPPVKNFKDVFADENYVMINTCIRINIITGKVVSVTKNSVTIYLGKDITRWGTQAYYHIDAVPSVTMPHKVLGTIATLLADNDITRRLRSIIIDKVPAVFSDEVPEGLKNKEAINIMERLNSYQQEALKAAVQTRDYVMIKGMPGTGKTQTLVALIELLSHLGYSVLITAHTHVAVDNILLKLLKKEMDFLRLGSKTRIHPLLHKYSDENFVRQCKTPEILEAQYNKKKIVAVTCLGANHSLLTRRMFDYCVVDECTQILQPVIIRPLFNAEKYVIVGDPDQLSAVIKSNEARKLGMDQDMFSRLDSKNNTRVLKQQYRMNKPIMDLANTLTYKGELLMGNDKVSNATLQFTDTKIMKSCEEWVKKALLNDLEHAVVILNTQEMRDLNLKLNSKNLSSKLFGCVNYLEAGIVLRLLNVLIQAGIKSEDIGVIAPFTAQVFLLKRLIKQKVEINTVDQYQGRDKSIILLSCTKNDLKDFNRQSNEYEILEDHTRLNVALTRAKNKLIIIGNKNSLMRFTPFEKLFNIIKKEEIILKSNYDDFSWDKLRPLIEE